MAPAAIQKCPQCERTWDMNEFPDMSWSHVYADHRRHCAGKPKRKASAHVGPVGAL